MLIDYDIGNSEFFFFAFFLCFFKSRGGKNCTQWFTNWFCFFMKVFGFRSGKINKKETQISGGFLCVSTPGNRLTSAIVLSIASKLALFASNLSEEENEKEKKEKER